MLIVKTIRKIRYAYQRDGKSMWLISLDFQLSRNTVRKVLRGEATEFAHRCEITESANDSWRIKTMNGMTNQRQRVGQ